MKSVLFLTTIIGAFLAPLTVGDTISCYTCLPTDKGCDSPFDTFDHQDWLKPCNSGKTCYKLIDTSNRTTRSCNDQDACLDGTTSSYEESCFNNICMYEFCCTGEGCNAALVTVPFGTLVAACLVLTTWAFTK